MKERQNKNCGKIKRQLDGGALARKTRQELGIRLTWAQAEEVLSMSRRAIQAHAFEKLRKTVTNLGSQKAIIEAEGFQFPLAGRLVWIGRRGRNFVVRIRA